MNCGAFAQNVEERADRDSRSDVDAVDATLRTLSQRIAHGEANDIAGRLPDDLADSITADDNERAAEISAMHGYRPTSASTRRSNHPTQSNTYRQC